jgi:hypothetical protein
MGLKKKYFLLLTLAILNFSLAITNANALSCNTVTTTNLNNIGYAINENGTNSDIPIFIGYNQLQCVGASGDITQSSNISVGTGANQLASVVIANSALARFNVLSGVTIANNDVGNAISVKNSTIVNFINDGTVDATQGIGENSALYIWNDSTINSLVNKGVITGLVNGISNAGTITNLDNAQGGASPLTYDGKLPEAYNIIVTDNSNFGRISITNPTGNMTFGISSHSSVGNSIIGTTLDNVLTGIAPSYLQGASSITASGEYITVSTNGFSGRLIYEGNNSWDLLMLSLGPSAADTQASLATQARRLRSTFNSTMASSNFANMNTYDCNLFDKNNMCISAGGRYTNINNPSSNNSAAVVVLGYKVSPNIRIGGFLDQSFNNNTPTGIQISNKNPMMGAFAVWNHQANGLGFQMKLANAYLDKDVTTSRAVIGTSEAGRGRTDLNTQSYVGELSYAFQYQDSTIVRPYFALRYTNIKQDGYTEDTTASVTAPLTYAKLGDRSTTALMGVKLNHALTPRTNLTASLGIEQDLHHKTDRLNASGVADLTSENFNNNIKRTRPVASAGAYYAVTTTQRLSGELYYQQLPFQSTASATAYVNYMIGF